MEKRKYKSRVLRIFGNAEKKFREYNIFIDKYCELRYNVWILEKYGRRRVFARWRQKRKTY